MFILILCLVVLLFSIVSIYRKIDERKSKQNLKKAFDEFDNQSNFEVDKKDDFKYEQYETKRYYLGEYACRMIYEGKDEIVDSQIFYEYGYEFVLFEEKNPVLKGIMDETKFVLYKSEKAGNSKDEFVSYLKKALDWHEISIEKGLEVDDKEIGVVNNCIFFTSAINGGIDDKPKIKIQFNTKKEDNIQFSYLCIYVISNTNIPTIMLVVGMNSVKKIIDMLDDDYVNGIISQKEENNRLANELLK